MMSCEEPKTDTSLSGSEDFFSYKDKRTSDRSPSSGACRQRRRTAGVAAVVAAGRRWSLAGMALLVLFALSGCGADALQRMRLAYTWGTFDYVYKSDAQKQYLLDSGSFAPENTTPFDVDFDPGSNRIFLALPALLPGSPAALVTIKDLNKEKSPRLEPYPSWEWQNKSNCDGLLSVFRTYVDGCRRLWVIDSGRTEITSSFTQTCPPALQVFDLRTDRLLRRHVLNVPTDVADSSLVLNVLAEQVGRRCSEDAYAYIADSGAATLYVYSLKQDKSWRVTSPTFQYQANATEFNVDGTTFSLEDGILALAQDSEFLYYHAFAGFTEGRVPKSVLRNQSLFADGNNLAEGAFQVIGQRQLQSAGEAFTNGNMFFSMMNTDAMYCWDSTTEYKSANFHEVEKDEQLLTFVTSVKVRHAGSWSEEVWAIDNNGQRLFAGQFVPNLPRTVNIVKGRTRQLAAQCRRGWSGVLPSFG